MKNKEETSSNFKGVNTQKITIKDGIAENTLTGEAKNELCKIKQIEKNVVRENLVYKTNEYTYNFQNFLTINTFGRDIYDSTITLKEADKDQSDKLVEILRNKENRKIQKKKQKKEDALRNLYALFEGRERVLYASGSKIFRIKIEGTSVSDHSNLKF